MGGGRGEPTPSVHRGEVVGAFLYVFIYMYPWKRMYMYIPIFTHLLHRNLDFLKTLPMKFLSSGFSLTRYQ